MHLEALGGLIKDLGCDLRKIIHYSLAMLVLVAVYTVNLVRLLGSLGVRHEISTSWIGADRIGSAHSVISMIQRTPLAGLAMDIR